MKTNAQMIYDLDTAFIRMINDKSLEMIGVASYPLNKYFVIRSDDNPITKVAAGYTDGKSITYIMDDSVTVDDLIVITIHEILHVLLNHLKRLNSRDKYLWNLACDHVVNNIICEFNKPVTVFNSSIPLVNFTGKYGITNNMSAEEVYDILVDKIKSGEIKLKIVPDDGSGAYIDVSKLGSDGNYETIGTSFEDTSIDDIEKYNDNHKKSEASKISNKKGNDIKKNLDDMKYETIKYFKNKCTKGSIPAEVARLINDYLTFKIPFEDIFENSIKYKSQVSIKRSWSTPNIYYRKYFKSPGIKNTVENNTLIIGIDASGSISDDDLRKAIYVILSSKDYFNKLIIYVHEVSVCNYFEVNINETKEDVFKKVRNISGGGGTSHEDIFNKIQEYSDDEGKLSMVVFITDGYSDIQENYKNYSFMYEVPVVWLISSSFNLSDILENVDHDVIKIE